MEPSPFRQPPPIKIAVLYTATWKVPNDESWDSFDVEPAQIQRITFLEIASLESLASAHPADTLNLREREQSFPRPTFVFSWNNGRCQEERPYTQLVKIHIDQIILLP